MPVLDKTKGPNEILERISSEVHDVDRGPTRVLRRIFIEGKTAARGRSMCCALESTRVGNKSIL